MRASLPPPLSALAGSDLTGSDGAPKYAYYLSVCGVLKTSAASGCLLVSSTSSACQVKVRGGSQSFDMGNWVTGSPAPVGPRWSYIDPSNKDAGVMLTMQGALQCWAEGNEAHYVAIVHFVCAAEQGPLTVVPAQGTCTQTWTLPTPLACRGPPIVDCSFDGYNFSSLAGTDLVGSDGGSNYSYYLSLCGRLSSAATSACTQISAQSSACQLQVQGGAPGPAFDIGNWAPNLPAPAGPQWAYIDSGNKALGVALTMRGAQQCGAAGNKHYVAVVHFVCAAERGPLTVAAGAGCTRNFTLPTPLACRADPDPDDDDSAPILSHSWSALLASVVALRVLASGL